VCPVASRGKVECGEAHVAIVDSMGARSRGR
jgi:hypothetical protein